MSILHKYKFLKSFVAIGAVDIVFFACFSPEDSTWVILPALLLVVATIWSLSRLLMERISVIVPLKLSIQKRLTKLLVIASSLVVALQSIGQLTAKDVLTIIPLVAILYFYLAYAGTTSAER